MKKALPVILTIATGILATIMSIDMTTDLLRLNATGPMYDEWHAFESFFRVIDGNWTIKDFTWNQGDHRILVPRLLMLLDIYFFSGSNVVARLFTFFSATLCCLTLWATHRNYTNQLKPIYFFALLAALAYAPMRYPYEVGINIGLVALNVFSFTSYFLFSRFTQKRTALRFFVCSISCLVCTWSFAPGLATWYLSAFFLMALDWDRLIQDTGKWFREEGKWVLGFVALGLVNTYFYFSDWQITQTSHKSFSLLTTPVDLIVFFIRLTGLSVGMQAPLAGTLFGGIGLIASLGLIALLFFRNRKKLWDNRYLVHTMLLLHSLFTMFVISVARHQNTFDMIDVDGTLLPGLRWIFHPVYFWLHLLVVVSLERWGKGATDLGRRAALIFLWVLIVLYPHHRDERKSSSYQEAFLRQSLIHTAIALDIRSKKLWEMYLSPGMYSYAWSTRDQLAQRDMLPFKELLGHPVRDDLPRCHGGSVDSKSVPLPTESANQIAFLFTGKFDESGDHNSRVAIINEERQIVGLGFPSRLHQKTSRAGPAGREWVGLSSTPQAKAKFILYPNASHSCLLESK